MDKDKKLEEFFKNRVSQLDSTEGDWDLPDASVFQNAQTHFPKHPKKRDLKLGFLLWAITGVLLFGLLGYVFHLNQNAEKVEEKVKNLETKLTIAKVDLEKKQNEITNLKNDFSQKKSQLENQNKVTSHTIETITQQNQKLKKTILKKENRINSLISKNQKVVAPVSNFSKKEIPNSTFSNPINFQKEQNIATLPARNFIFLENEKSNFKIPINAKSIIYKKPLTKSRKGRFEIGLGYTSMTFEMPLDYDFEKLDEEDFGKKDFSFPIQTKGGSFNLAYSIRPNLWLTTGFRRTSGGFEKSFSSKLIYDKSGEYIDLDGKTVNEFDINTQSGFGEVGNSIGFEIPTNTNLDDGDFLEADWVYGQQFKLTHIPIGLNYFFGKNKFQGFIKSGLGWNLVSFGTYSFEAKLKYENENLPIKKSEKSKEEKSSSSFFNAFAGVGLNYQLTQHWNARTSFSFEKNINSTNKHNLSNTWNKIFDIGLHYRF